MLAKGALALRNSFPRYVSKILANLLGPILLLKDPSLETVARSDIRIAEIDGLRGTAVLLVLIWHFIGAVLSQATSLSKIVSAILIFGRTGVDLFFVLSGFLIIGILVDRRNSANYFHVFFIRRALRILPPYTMLLVVFWTLTAISHENYYFGSQIPWWSFATFTQNWYIIKINAWGPGAASVTWSVAIEEQFYIVFPIIVYLIPRKYLIHLLICVGISSILARAACFLLYPQNAFAPYVATCLRLDGLCAGGILAIAYRDDLLRQKLIAFRQPLRNANVAFAAFIPFFLVAMHWRPGTTMYYWGHTYLTVLYSLTLATILTNPGSRFCDLLRVGILRGLGTISYTVYLFHPLFIGVAFLAAGKIEELKSISDAFLLVAAMILTLMFSKASHLLIESKFLAFGHRLKYSPTSTEYSR
ncbi:acyltransferase [Bradyrhizobium sp. WYCCWR 13022]|uniref:acyltransferase family protein n=1 Tax=unclassified Bradyrhizobium TaxID=2631580 RepID=UPI00263ACB69|nr:acyltransferase [Bradyrhizobium sp. WYCCWR 13022]MDN4986745.1 acyltransferase [Bradyrhizobium sp. WYCCWR 13022]